LRTHLSTTPVYNAQLFTESLEKAYMQAFERWCNQTDPALPAA
jgi:hypothetical protein